MELNNYSEQIKFANQGEKEKFADFVKYLTIFDNWSHDAKWSSIATALSATALKTTSSGQCVNCSEQEYKLSMKFVC